MKNYHFYARTISSEEAQAILDAQNVGNRPFKKVKIAQYARAMIEGKWKFTPIPLIFEAPNGKLLDGQNRLAAVVQAGKPQVLVICDNADLGIMSAIDQGASRSPKDHLATRGIHGGASLAPLLLAIMSHEENPRGNWATRKPASNEEYIETFEADPILIEEAVGQGKRYNKTYRLISATDYSFVFYLMAKQHAPRHRIDDFLHRLSAGTGLREDEPVYVYRKWLVNSRDRYKGDRSRRQRSVNNILKVANAHFAGEAWSSAFRPAPLEPTPTVRVP